MSIDIKNRVSTGWVGRNAVSSGIPARDLKQGADSADQALTVSLSDEALARYQQAASESEESRGRKIDDLIASWFKHVSPANTEADKRATAEEDHQKQIARAAGRVWSDPGHVADPVKEPSRATVEMAVGIIETDQMLQAMQPHHDPSEKD